MKCSSISTESVCFDDGAGNRQSLVAHYEYGSNAAGDTILVATRYTEADGVTVVDTSAGTVAVGACAVAAPDIEFVKLCDVSAAGVATEFYRKITVTFNASGVATVTTADVAANMVTPYVVSGTVGDCNQDCDASTALGVLTTWG